LTDKRRPDTLVRFY